MGIKLTRRQVSERFGGVSVRTIERWTEDPNLNFPQPIRYGYQNPLYDLDELIEWERKRKEPEAQAKAKAKAKAKAGKAQAKALANQVIDLADLDVIVEEAAA